MPNIILKDWRGVERTYPNKSSVTVKNDQGGTTTFYLPEGKVNITDTQEVDVSQYAAAQIVDENLVPENIAEDVTVLGITGTFKGIVPTGNKEITTKEPVDVTQFATAQVVDSDLTPPNIRYGTNILGVSGSLQSPSFIIGNGTGAARLWYNKSYPWDEILPSLSYLDGVSIIEYLKYNDDHSDLVLAVRKNKTYGVCYSRGAYDAALIYATAPFDFESQSLSVHIHFDKAGWYGDYLNPTKPVINTVLIADIPDTLFASAEIAFGDWIKRPTETLRITQNGTYDVTGYAQVIVNVEGSEGGDPVVDGKTLVFDDATSVDGKTLVIDLDATVEGKILIFGGAEEAVVDGKYLVTSGSVDGKTAILDGRVDGKTLIL